MAKILFHLGHPAHFHLFKHVIHRLSNENHIPLIVIKKKDVLEDLLIESKIPFNNILPSGKSKGKSGLIKDLIIRGSKLVSFSLKQKPDVLVGTSADISYVGKLLGIPSINVNEDDADVVPLYAKMAYPWATKILSPDVCFNGKWDSKSKKYAGYHELAYLNPDLFTPDIHIVSKTIDLIKPYYILRFSSLNAHHDTGIKGFSNDLVREIINILTPTANVYITSERELDLDLQQYVLKINPSEMHHFLAYAQGVIGDSQTMSAEAAVLGTPYIRFNDFVGKIGYLNELENQYGLGFGFKTNDIVSMMEKVKDFAKLTSKTSFKQNRERMLQDKINVADFIYDEILFTINR